jgi:hypothetical protein
MTDEFLERWPRPLFVPLPLQSYFFFVIYGVLDESFPAIAHVDYRSHGLPEGLELVYHSLKDRPELRNHFQSGPDWDRLRLEFPEVVESIQEAPTCLVLRGELPDTDHLNSLRDCIGLIQFLLDHGGSAVCDVLTGNWYRGLDWRLQVFDEGSDAPSGLVSYLSIEQPDGSLHLYTRGMRRFARPDLSMRCVLPGDESRSLAMIQHLVESLIAGGSIPEGKQLRFPELSTSVTCHWQGSLDDPLFHNFFIGLAGA